MTPKMYKPVSSLILFALVLFFSACGGGESSSDKNTTGKSELKSAAGGVNYGGIFKINEVQYLRSLFPHNVGEVVGHRITNQIYEGLVCLNQETLEVEPSLAESYTISDDALTYTFKLRKGVRFHDDPCFKNGKGREFKASDVKYCLDRLCSSSSDNKGYDFVRDRITGAEDMFNSTKNGKPLAGGVRGVKVLDEYAIEIKLDTPFSSFLQILAMPFGQIFPKEAYDKYGVEMRIKTVGTGPFYLKALRENEAVILLKNPNYWDKDKNGNQLPYLDGVRFSFVGDKMAELLEFKQGNLDMSYQLPIEVAEEIADRKGNLRNEYKKFKLQEVTSMAIQYYGFLNSGKIFNNKKLRQAFCYSIDRQKLCDFTLKGMGTPGVYGMVPPAFANYDYTNVKGYSYKPEKARKLLSEAGYPGGKGFPKLNLQINSGGKRNEQVAEAIQKMINETLNIDISIDKMPWAQHTENTEAGKVDFWRLGWIADYPDPENFLTYLWSKHLPEDPKANTYLNTFRYKNAEFDKFFSEALKTVDDKKRMELYQQADQIALSDAPYMPLYYDKDRRLIQSNVANFPMNPMEYRLLRDVYFTE